MKRLAAVLLLAATGSFFLTRALLRKLGTSKTEESGPILAEPLVVEPTRSGRDIPAEIKRASRKVPHPVSGL